MSRATVARRERDPKFQERVAYYRNLKAYQILGLLSEAGSDAVEALHLVAIDDNAKHADRIKAAEKILDRLLQHRSEMDQEERLRIVEERLGLTYRPPDASGESGPPVVPGGTDPGGVGEPD